MKTFHQYFIVPGLSVIVWISLFNPRAISQQNKHSYQEFELTLTSEHSSYFKDGLYTGQERHFPSFTVEPEYYLEWADGNQSLNFTGFFRLDRDSRRTHWDIRELYWQTVKNNWEISIGVKKVFP